MLIEVNIPLKVKRIEQEAFINCINLPSLKISKSLEFIGKDAFAACNILDNIYYEGNESDWLNINKTNSGLTEETIIHYNQII